MIDIIEAWTGDGVVALRMSGKLQHRDYERLTPRLEQEIDKHGPIRCLIDLSEMDGIEPRAVLDEVRFDLKHAGDVTRCAVVGNRHWEKWVTSAARPVFHKAEVRFFASEECDEAAAWVRDGLPSHSAA